MTGQVQGRGDGMIGALTISILPGLTYFASHYGMIFQPEQFWSLALLWSAPPLFICGLPGWDYVQQLIEEAVLEVSRGVGGKLLLVLVFMNHSLSLLASKYVACSSQCFSIPASQIVRWFRLKLSMGSHENERSGGLDYLCE